MKKFIIENVHMRNKTRKKTRRKMYEANPKPNLKLIGRKKNTD